MGEMTAAAVADRTIPPVGAKVWVRTDKRPYTVRARNEFFAVCTKPFNARRTVLHCILDARRGLRGPENLIFGMGAETDQQCAEMLARLTAGESEVSHRHCVEWDVVGVPARETPHA
jgi:hypothetical protein